MLQQVQAVTMTVYMLNPVRPPSESSNLGVILRTINVPFIKIGKKSIF